MKLSELLDRCQDLLEEYGDQDVYVDTRFLSGKIGELTVVEFQPNLEMPDDEGDMEDHGDAIVLIAD